MMATFHQPSPGSLGMQAWKREITVGYMRLFAYKHAYTKHNMSLTSCCTLSPFMHTVSPLMSLCLSVFERTLLSSDHCQTGLTKKSVYYFPCPSFFKPQSLPLFCHWQTWCLFITNTFHFCILTGAPLSLKSSITMQPQYEY